MSGWYFESLEKKPITGALAGVSGGKPTLRKVLVSKNKFDGQQSLSNISIASSSTEEHTRNLLQSMLGSAYVKQENSVRVLKVPRDLDGLMALRFGTAGACLTTVENFENFTRNNNKLKNQIMTWSVSEPMLRLVVAARPGTRFNERIRIITDMQIDQDGAEKLALLGLDGWIDYMKSTRIEIEKEDY